MTVLRSCTGRREKCRTAPCSPLHQKSLPHQMCSRLFFYLMNMSIYLFAHLFTDAFLAKDAEGDGSGKEDGRECAENHAEYHGEGK